MVRQLVPSFPSRHSPPLLCVLCGSLALVLLLSLVQVFFSSQEQYESAPTSTNVDKQGPPFHNWSKTKSWLCPHRVPNLTAAVATFQLAQQLGLKGGGRADVNLSAVKSSDIQQYFSFWPGHVFLREKKTNKTATFLRTYKCGSETIEEYFKQISFLGEVEEHVDFQAFVKSAAKDSECIGSIFRDPMDHFFSGLGELELRRIKWRIGSQELAEYEKIDVLSADRVIAFTEFLLRGDWFEYQRDEAKKVPYHWLDFGHVFPQSGYLVWLHSLNRTVYPFVQLHSLSRSLPLELEQKCGLMKGLPAVAKIRLHDKVEGMSEVHRRFWANGSVAALSRTARLHIVQALCLFHAMDYACLASVLEMPPPEICLHAFEKHL